MFMFSVLSFIPVLEPTESCSTSSTFELSKCFFFQSSIDLRMYWDTARWRSHFEE